MKTHPRLPFVKSLFGSMGIAALVFICSCSKTNLREQDPATTNQQTEIKSEIAAPCFKPLYRYWDGAGGDHFYTITQANYAGYVFEQRECGVYCLPAFSNQVAFHRYWSASAKDHFYTTVQGNYGGYVYEGIECYVWASSTGSNIPLYRYWNSSNKDHFYTVTAGSYSGYVYEGIACYVDM
jgi:hypothetical protein